MFCILETESITMIFFIMLRVKLSSVEMIKDMF